MNRARAILRRACLAPALLCLLLAAAPATGRVYQGPDEFLAEVFHGNVPEPGVIWIDGDLAEKARSILGHDYAALRVRYWLSGERSAWILEEVGKERPITVGIVVNAGTIELLKVLEYRESRGGEVRAPSFTSQFRGAGLGDDLSLDRPIDGISGATLSVHALKRLAALALLFHRQVSNE